MVPSTLRSRVVVLLAVLALVQTVWASPASARIDAEFSIGAPVDGRWASTDGCPAPFPSHTCSQPRSHSVDYSALDGTPAARSWAVDLGGPSVAAGAGVYLYLKPYGNGVSVTTRVELVSPACAPGTGKAGRVVVIGIYHGSRKVGTVAYAHVKATVTEGQTIAPWGTQIGTVGGDYLPSSCWDHLHLHIEMGNTNNYPCFDGGLHSASPWGDTVRRADFIGWVGGRRASGPRQACPL